MSSVPQGLRFSGANDTDFRVYLLGNPVSVAHPCSAHEHCARESSTFLSSFCLRVCTGDLVAESGEHRSLPHLKKHHCHCHAERCTALHKSGRSGPLPSPAQPSSWGCQCSEALPTVGCPLLCLPHTSLLLCLSKPQSPDTCCL